MVDIALVSKIYWYTIYPTWPEGYRDKERKGNIEFFIERFLKNLESNGLVLNENRGISNIKK